ncbi:uncharacterized protein LOC122803302 [Protopterus annectens]|uniref:uncharacterized protein LOC122803302 n=1 Tax=Protopterus annectens TaxID=7888 RepID=UPI001CF9C5F5|nr:uncharacterized protein LOC122803302 [Protopterus annectens]
MNQLALTFKRGTAFRILIQVLIGVQAPCFILADQDTIFPTLGLPAIRDNSTVITNRLFELLFSGMPTHNSMKSTEASDRETSVTEVTQLRTSEKETLKPFIMQALKRKVKEGEKAILSCQFSHPTFLGLKGIKVKWYKEDGEGCSDVAEKNLLDDMMDKEITWKGYFIERTFISSNWSTGDLSLTITNVTVGDHGIYFCQVTLPNGRKITGKGTKVRIQRRISKSVMVSFPFLV